MRIPRLPCLFLLAGVMAAARPADAMTLQVFQEWRDPLFASNGQSVETVIQVDTTSLTGSGTETILANFMQLVEYLTVSGSKFGQNAYWDNFATPPTLTEGHIQVEFVNGAFNRMLSVNMGGNGFVPLVNQSTGTVTAVMTVSGGLLNYGTALSLNQYDEVTASRVITTIPEPGSLALLACSCGALYAWRRRRA